MMQGGMNMNWLGNRKEFGLRRFFILRTILICGALIFGLLSASNDARAQAQEGSITFNIPAQSLESALAAFADQARLQIIVPHSLVVGMTSPGLAGSYRASDALKELLSGSGLQYKMTGANTITVVRDAHPQSAAPTPSRSEATVSAEPGPLTEIVVTAQKRSERLQDVPVPVTAVSAAALADQNQLRIQDFYTSVPGLNLIGGTQGEANLSIRGVTTGATNGNPTVGITIDDVPFGPSSTYGAGGGGGIPTPDIDPTDLARVEVLRGPQGTLYGTSSIGGLVKFVTVDPSVSQLGGEVAAGLSDVQNGPHLGYNVRGSINVPLGDSAAFRVSAFTREDPGYIDNVQTGERGVNKVDVEGGHFSLLWHINSDISLKFGALLQETKGYGSPEVDIGSGLGDLQQSNLINTGEFEKKAQVYSLNLNAKIGLAELTSVTGYNIATDVSSYDFTPLFGPYFPSGIPGTGFNGYGVSGASFTNDIRTSKVSEEVRLRVPFGSHLDWLAGLFYTHESSRTLQDVLAVDSTTGSRAGTFLDASWPTTYEEYAAFTDLTIHVTDQFSVQLGGRESENRQTYSEIDAGPYAALFELGDPTINPEVDTKDNSFTYLVTPQFKFTPDMMLYARLASGYRSGGPNPTSTVFGVPPHFSPDRTENYELGFKGDFLDRLLSVDASVYYIDWKDIQLLVLAPVSGANYYTNGSRAKSQGVELSTELKPLQHLRIGAWVAFNDAVLTSNLPLGAPGTAVGLSGDRLPASSRFSGNVSAEEDIALGTNWMMGLGGDVSYVGNRLGVFTTTEARQQFPSYVQTNLHANLNYGSWKAALFANNVTNRRGIIAGGLGTYNPSAFEVIQPRTVGLTVSRSF
jgi:iron complex outermembrane receptor protein